MCVHSLRVRGWIRFCSPSIKLLSHTYVRTYVYTDFIRTRTHRRNQFIKTQQISSSLQLEHSTTACLTRRKKALTDCQLVASRLDSSLVTYERGTNNRHLTSQLLPVLLLLLCQRPRAFVTPEAVVAVAVDVGRRNYDLKEGSQLASQLASQLLARAQPKRQTGDKERARKKESEKKFLAWLSRFFTQALDKKKEIFLTKSK